MTAWLATLEWTRPWAFAALVLPLVLLALALRRPRPHELATGTVALWRALAARPEGAHARRRSRRAPPPALLLALAALAAAAVALAGPRQVDARAPRTFEVLVDRSPSMYLAGADGATRLERGLEQARELLAGVVRAGDRVTWSAWEGGGWSTPVAEPERAWRDEPPRAVAGDDEPPFAERDRPGTLWVTDGPPVGPADGPDAERDPDGEPHAAGRVAVGGPAVPGPVGALGTTRIDWDGERLIERAAALPGRVARMALPDPSSDALRDLGLVLELWADERGLAFERVPLESSAAKDAEGDARVALTLVAVPVASPVEVDVGRDGWRARARVAAAGLAADSARATWLADDAGLPLVGWRAGRVEAAFAGLADLEGDPAPFAASWAELFDRAQRRAPGVVPLDERRAARALPPRAPVPPDEAGAADAPRWLPTAVCAAVAAALAAAAVLAAEAARWRSA